MSIIANQKLNKRTSETVLETINFTDLLDGGTIASITSIEASSDLTITSEEINSTELELDGQTIEIGNGIQFEVAGGVNLTEYIITITIVKDTLETLVAEVIIFITNALVDYYGSVAAAEEYFSLRLGSDSWSDATTADKLKSLIQATRAIDRLNFVSDKTSEDQLLQFPRDDETETPEDISVACYEEALQLLSGSDANEEMRSLGLLSQGISTAKETYDRSSNPLNVISGIVSPIAWSYLFPYLRDAREVIVSRV